VNLSGDFESAAAVDGDAADFRGSYGTVYKPENTVINQYFDSSDTRKYAEKLTRAEERHWQETYEELRNQANAGYADAVRDGVLRIIAQIEAFEESESLQVSTELKSSIYRLAAIAHLPHQTGGCAELCAAFLDQAQAFSTAEGSVQCQVIEGLLLYQTDDTENALSILDNLTTDEAVRLRFAIHVEANHIEVCRRMIIDHVVNPDWSQTDLDWTRALSSYYALTGEERDMNEALARLIREAPTARSYQGAAQCLAQLAYAKMYEFCLAHDMFPDFHIGLDLNGLVDSEASNRAALLFAESAKLYQQHGCARDAALALTSAIRLTVDSEQHVSLNDWIGQLRSLDPGNPVLVGLVRSEATDASGAPPTIFSLYPLLNNPDTDPLCVLRAALAVSNTPSRASEVASVLREQAERFRVTDSSFAQYVFAVLQLLVTSDGSEQAIEWLDQSAASLSHPRLHLLFHAWLHWHQNDFDLAESWLERALSVAPKHPEVLAAAVIIFHQTDSHHKKLDQARTLFGILRTRQTASWYLGALFGTPDFQTFLEVLDDVQDLPLDETLVRANRARALLALGRAPEARADLEWLRDSKLAEAPDLTALAQIYMLVSEPDRAIAVLLACVGRFPDTVDAYRLLSTTYLMMGRERESFEWSLKARRRFPRDPHVSLDLWWISHPTGHELHPEVGKAFRGFLPGGEFADQSPFIPFTMDQLLDLARSSQEQGRQPEDLYRIGQIPRISLCMWRNVPMFLAHEHANSAGEVRYIADGDQSGDLAHLTQDRPRQIVLDYPALLTLWSLFGTDMLLSLSQYFDCVWLPAALRTILLAEQDRMATYGQLARYEARCAVRNALNTWTDKVELHAQVDLEEGWDITGLHTEVAIAELQNLVHLNEHVPPSHSPPSVPTVGLAVLADILCQAGEISPLAAEELGQSARPPHEGERELAARLSDDRQVVANLSTLVSWAMRHELQPLMEYLECAHVAQPALDRLQAEMRAYEFRQQSLEGIRSLRRLLRQGEEEGLIVFGAIAEEERVIRKMIEQERAARPTDEENALNLDRAPNSLARHLDDYLDELLGLARREDIPIWTDDRWTRKLRVANRQPRHCFGTDSFLAFAHSNPVNGEWLSATEYHTYYDQLVTWGYCFLPIDAEHILWHLQRGGASGNRSLDDLLRHYRDRLIEIWDVSDAQGVVDKQFGAYLLGLYNQQLLEAFRVLHTHDASLETSAVIFAALDLSRHAASRILGREPHFFSALFLHAIMPGSDAEPTGVAMDYLSDDAPKYPEWLSEVILASGVAPEVVEEAWYQLLRYPLAMLDAAQTDLDQRVAMAFLVRMLEAASTEVTQYLLTTDIGPRLREDFGLHEQVCFDFGGSAAPDPGIHLPAQEWQRDYDQALTEYLQNPSEEAISTRLATLRIRPVAEGSIFLVAEAIPTEVYELHPDARGVTDYLMLLPGFTDPNVIYREALWRIGLQALADHKVTTEVWYSGRDDLLAAKQRGIQSGGDLLRYLLGIGSVALEYFAQAARLSPSVISQLLIFIEPEIIRAWLAIPELDWSSRDDLRQWAEQSASRYASSQDQPDLTTLVDQLGRTIFADAAIVRHHMATALNDATSDLEKHQMVEELLSFAEVQSSLTLRANVVLALYESHSCHEEQSCPTSGSWDEMGERILSLTVSVLHGSIPADDQRAVIARLEATICHWLYRSWAASVADGDDCTNELAYLASVGASHIIDALAVDGQITQQVAQDVADTLSADLDRKAITGGSEPQPDGFYRPVWGIYLNYPASFLLQGLLADDLPTLRFRSTPEAKAAALVCGVRHRHEQAICSPVLPSSSWLDSELAADIGIACADFLEKLNEHEPASSSEQEPELWHFVTSPDAGVAASHTLIASIPEIDEEEMVMQRVLWLFHARAQPCITWFDLLRHLLEPRVLDHLRQFEACYGEVMLRLGDLLMHPGVDFPSDVLALSRDLLFEVPVGKNTSALLRIKAAALSQLVNWGFDLASVCQWLIGIAQSDKLDVPVVRSVLRPFILFWPRYAKEIRDPLFDTLMQIGQLPGYASLWEFARLARHRQLDLANEAGNANRQ